MTKENLANTIAEDAKKFTNVDQNKVKDLSKLCDEKINLDAKITEAKQLLKNLEDNEKQISQELIPEALQEAGVSSLTLKDGSKVEVRPKYAARIPIKHTDEAFNYLKSKGHDDIIKNEIIIRFGRGEEDKATALVKELDKRGLMPDQKRRIEPMTLKGFVREQIEKGTDLPQDKFGVYIYYDTKIIKP
jgi:hypothetical protein